MSIKRMRLLLPIIPNTIMMFMPSQRRKLKLQPGKEFLTSGRKVFRSLLNEIPYQRLIMEAASVGCYKRSDGNAQYLAKRKCLKRKKENARSHPQTVRFLASEKTDSEPF